MSSRFFPAEWHPQDAIQFAWPHAQTDWVPWLDAAQSLYAELVSEISHYQTVVLVCDPSLDSNEIKMLLNQWQANLANLRFYSAPTNDTWARDHAAISVLDNDQPLLLDFQFNAWGSKFSANHDNEISSALAKQGAYAAPLKSLPLVLEGGSIESDGQGTLLTTSACLLNPNRNPELSKEQIEQALKQELGVSRVLWLDHGHLAGDDTDSHIDTLARFISPSCIAYVQCQDPTDPHHCALSQMEAQLQGFTQANGQPYDLVALPMPSPKLNAEGELLPATYANFLITNEQILVPTYQDSMDQVALNRLHQAMPDRQVKGIDCSVLIEQFGSLHCISMQLIKGALA